MFKNKLNKTKKSIFEKKWTIAFVVGTFAIGGLLNAVGSFVTVAVGGVIFTSSSAVKYMANYCKNKKKSFDNVIDDKIQTKFDDCVKDYNLKDWSERRKYTFVGSDCSDDIDAFFNFTEMPHGKSNRNTSHLKFMMCLLKKAKEEKEEKKEE